MPRKNALISAHTVTAASMGADVISPPTNIAFLDNIMLQLNYAGTGVGTFEVQVSADYSQDSQGAVINAGNWIPLTVSPALAAPAGSNGVSATFINQCAAPWIRVKYTRTSGTGTLDMYVNGKEV